MQKVKLTKIRSTHSNLRTDEIEGYTPRMPEAGEAFVMMALPLYKSLQEGFMREIKTTMVQRVMEDEDGSLRFETRNSQYKLEKL